MYRILILAGGRSSRMGSNKAFLKLNTQSFIEKQISELSQIAPVVVVSNEPQLYRSFPVLSINDEFPGFGPLAGIHAGLKAVAPATVFVVPCDMPLVSGELAKKMFDLLGDADGVVLKTNGHLEPLCAVYTQRCLPAIEECLRSGRLKVTNFYPKVKMRIVDVNDLSLDRPVDEVIINVNTPEEFAHFKERTGI